MKFKLFLLLSFSIYFNASAQLQYFSPETMNGYTLFSGEQLFLINNCGEIVHSWEDVNPRFHAKLLPNGHIVYIDFFSKNIIERDWDNNLIHDLAINDDDIDLNYEVIVLPNGNYLCIARRSSNSQELKDIGFDFDNQPSPFQTDLIVELDANSGTILWEWNIMDHVIQERSDTIPNFGSIIDHPELLNLDAISTYDWSEEFFMINGMDYNPSLDQVILSLRKLGEVVIIDHSTTTEEAAGHTGGNSNKGGDILYRWGNPQNYNRGTSSDQKLFFQHNPNWIEHGDHEGKIIIYNNGLNDISTPTPHSTVPIISLPILSNGNYEINELLAFEPSLANENYGMPSSPNQFYSAFTSAAKVLQNGNILITVGDDKRIIELTPLGELVWEYELGNAGLSFRVEKYPTDYPAFENRDLTPMGTVEDPPSTVPCEIATSSKDYLEETLEAWVDANSRQLFIKMSTANDYDLEFYDLAGAKLYTSFISKSDIENAIPIFNQALPFHLSGLIILNMTNQQNGNQLSFKLFVN